MQGPSLGQLLGEVVLEHEGLDGQCSWPLLLAVAKDWSAFSTTPVSSSSCIPLGMAVGWAPWDSKPWIHQWSQGPCSAALRPEGGVSLDWGPWQTWVDQGSGPSRSMPGPKGMGGRLWLQ